MKEFVRTCALFAALVLVALSSVHALGEEPRSVAASESVLAPQVSGVMPVSVAAVQSSSPATQSGTEPEQQGEAAAFDETVIVTVPLPIEKNTTDVLETITDSNIQQQVDGEAKLSVASPPATPAAPDAQHKSGNGDSASVGAQSAVILAAGAAICAVLAITFKKQTTAKKKHSRDAKDPMMQSLLYSDLDYAAM